MAGKRIDMDLSYALTPFIAWFVAGSAKFLINSFKAGKWAFGQIGYGGLPSNHSAVVGSTATLIALKEGVGHPAFGVAVSLAFIVMLDANSLRRQVGKQAEAINHFLYESNQPLLRERMGHSKMEILAGLGTGAAVAGLIHCLA